MFWNKNINDYEDSEKIQSSKITEIRYPKVHVLTEGFGLNHPKSSIEYLKQGDMLLISYDNTDKKDIARSYDYFTGVSDALHAMIKQVAEKTFIIIPEGAEYEDLTLSTHI